MQFAAARLPRFSGPRSSWADRSSRRVSRAVAGPPTDWGCKAAIQGAAAHHESGGATRAAPLAMRAHRGTGSSHPLPSSEESANLPRYADRVVGRWSEEPPLTVPLANDHPVSVKSDLDQLFKFSQLADALAGVLEVAARDSGEGPARSGFRSALRDLIPRCETSQGFLRLSGPLDLRRGADFPQMGGPWLR